MGFGSPSVKARALRHLARREHSRAELERKLAAVVEDKPEASAAEQIRAALDELSARGLLSDERAAESVLSAQARRLGSRRLQYTLQSKGLAPELIRATLQQARDTELERARDLWRRRFGAPAADAAGRARQLRFLAGRGFDADIARRVVQGTDDAAEPS